MQIRRDAPLSFGHRTKYSLNYDQNKLDFEDAKTSASYEGPVEVLKKVGNTSYKVALPTWMKIHPVIYVSNLKPYHQDTEDL